MKFGRIPLAEALGAVVGHTLRLGAAGVLKKGRRLTAEDLVALAAAGHAEVVAACLDADDVGEDAAAARIAAALVNGAAAMPGGARMAAAATGRCNLHAVADGVLRVDRARVDGLNAIDEAVTVATLPPDAPVRADDMIATVKIIPYAVPRAVVEACEAAARVTGDGPGAIGVAAFRGFRAGLILTRLAGVHESVIDRAAAAQRARAERLAGSVARELRCHHDVGAVAAALRTLLDEGCAPVLLLGASAIADRGDVIPAAIELAGGTIEHFGMPVDPGNLLLLARRGEVTILGAPGCARSLKRSGFDMALERIAAGIPVTREYLVGLGVGGLLVEIPSRPAPREQVIAEVAHAPAAVGAIVLAAGHSRRMGERNKLLAMVGGVPMVARVVDALLATRVRPVVVVTGHDQEAVRGALAGREVRFVHNAQHALGMSGSLRAGVEALARGGEVDGVLVCLGDMPRLAPRHVEALLDGFAPDWPSEAPADREGGRPLCVPVFEGKRGNPVLFARRYFAELCALEGDVGARALIERHAEEVRRVDAPDDGVLVDVDTPEMLAAITAPVE